MSWLKKYLALKGKQSASKESKLSKKAELPSDQIKIKEESEKYAKKQADAQQKEAQRLKRDLQVRKAAEGSLTLRPRCPICYSAKLSIGEVTYRSSPQSRVMESPAGVELEGQEMLCNVCGCYITAPVDAQTFFSAFDIRRFEDVPKLPPTSKKDPNGGEYN